MAVEFAACVEGVSYCDHGGDNIFIFHYHHYYQYSILECRKSAEISVVAKWYPATSEWTATVLLPPATTPLHHPLLHPLNSDTELASFFILCLCSIVLPRFSFVLLPFNQKWVKRLAHGSPPLLHFESKMFAIVCGAFALVYASIVFFCVSLLHFSLEGSHCKTVPLMSMKPRVVLDFYYFSFW